MCLIHYLLLMEPSTYDIEHGYGKWTGSYNYVRSGKVYRDILGTLGKRVIKNGILGYGVKSMTSHAYKYHRGNDFVPLQKHLREVTPHMHSSSESGSSDHVNAEINSLAHSGCSSLTVRTLDGSGQNGNKEVVIRCRAKKRKHRSLQYKDVLNILFPQRLYHLKTYGKSTVATIATAAGVTSVTATASASSKYIDCVVGSQGFYQYEHYPLNDYAGLNTNVYRVGQMMSDLNKNQTFMNNTTDYSSNVNTNLPDHYQQKYTPLEFCGGYTEHIFYNTGNGDITFECWEARPKEPLVTKCTPLTCLLLDKQFKGPSATGLPVPGAPSSFLQSTEPDFTVQASDHLFHRKYNCSNNKKIKILAGETVKIIVEHPPFYSDSAMAWESLINPNIFDTGATTTSDIDYLPCITVFLMVRFHGQVITDDSSGSITRVNLGACQLAHMQREYFRARHVPPHNAEQSQYINGWTDAPATGYICNNLTNKAGEPAIK